MRRHPFTHVVVVAVVAVVFVVGGGVVVNSSILVTQIQKTNCKGSCLNHWVPKITYNHERLFLVLIMNFFHD